MSIVAKRSPISAALELWLYWATVCETVRTMLSDRCLSVSLSFLSVLSCLSVMLVYCGQKVGRIKMKLGVWVGLSLATLCSMGTQLPLS